jgi:hypothetical protein
MPARNISMPLSAKRTAVSVICSSVSQEHGPEIITGRWKLKPQSFRGVMFKLLISFSLKFYSGEW